MEQPEQQQQHSWSIPFFSGRVLASLFYFFFICLVETLFVFLIEACLNAWCITEQQKEKLNTDKPQGRMNYRKLKQILGIVGILLFNDIKKKEAAHEVCCILRFSGKSL